MTNRKSLILTAALTILLLLAIVLPGPAQEPDGDKKGSEDSILFRFTLTCGNRDYEGFSSVLQELKKKVKDEGDFHIIPGDFDPPEKTFESLKKAFGEDVKWYPCAGNYDCEKPDKDEGKGGPERPGIDFMHKYFDKHLAKHVNPGPKGSEKTTYSFDHKNAHFVVLNQYFDGKTEWGADGDIVDELYEWLAKDLETNKMPVVFVIGHEPAYPKDSQDNDCLNKHKKNRDRFWKLLEDKKVTAHFVGHTQGPSAYKTKEGKVWEVNCGQARGSKDKDAEHDSFVNVIVRRSGVQFQLYQNVNKDGDYVLKENFTQQIQQENKKKSTRAILEKYYLEGEEKMKSFTFKENPAFKIYKPSDKWHFIDMSKFHGAEAEAVKNDPNRRKQVDDFFKTCKCIMYNEELVAEVKVFVGAGAITKTLEEIMRDTEHQLKTTAFENYNRVSLKGKKKNKTAGTCLIFEGNRKNQPKDKCIWYLFTKEKAFYRLCIDCLEENFKDGEKDFKKLYDKWKF